MFARREVSSDNLGAPAFKNSVGLEKHSNAKQSECGVLT